MTGDVIYAWRHPQPIGAQGRCIGRTDLAIDARKAKRLARQVQKLARAKCLPEDVVTSPLERCHAVGRWLRRWGWRHRVDPLLLEFDFGRWDGQPWSSIPVVEIDAWCAAFATAHPGGGESVEDLLDRVTRFEASPARVVVTHGGWLAARRWLANCSTGYPTALTWPAAPNYSECWAEVSVSGARASLIGRRM